MELSGVHAVGTFTVTMPPGRRVIVAAPQGFDGVRVEPKNM